MALYRRDERKDTHIDTLGVPILVHEDKLQMSVFRTGV